MRYCWFKNNERTDIKCANVKEKKISNCEITVTLDSDYFLNEKIVVGSYYSEKDLENSNDVDTADYLVSDFPFAYKKLTYEEVQAIKNDGSDDDDDDDCKHEPYSYTDSSNKFKVSGKKYAKAAFSDAKKEDIDESDFYLAPSKPKNYEDYEKKCTDYKKNDDVEDDDIVCDYDISPRKLWLYVQERYKDGNQGKVAPGIKKYFMREARPHYNTIYRDEGFLYTTALINLIIQIIGILFWACGRFLGLLLGGGGDAKTQSEGEA